eukprot:comp15853_c0_seq1/m.13180 comp15853_c0_seq1/g.13180  ORF comp15853_c0_seq1/g.13180 comp15853_c0_seq1/m.13180 type:complete len:493 (-) comp15853_c0_seq1:268-1746(-)
MGVNSSKIEKALGAGFPEHERFYGLENFGNTCYCNSVLQALYFCPPFRQHLQAHAYARKNSGGSDEENILTSLAELFTTISTQRRRTGVIPPRKFIAQLRKENELFRGFMQQDAHEFLNYLLNTVAELLAEEQRKELGLRKQASGPDSHHLAGRLSLPLGSSSKGSLSQRFLSKKRTNSKPHVAATFDPPTPNSNADQASLASGHSSYSGQDSHGDKGSTDGRGEKKVKTWVQDIFEGVLTNETRCLSCETVSSKDECFLDLSVDIEQNSSITKCLRSFSETEYLQGEHKYFCDKCCSLQEAQKRMRIKKLPPILALHLKRFKYIEELQRYKKLSYRVVFPMELKLFNTSDDAENPDQMYDLFAVVIHVGSGPNHGHYISIVKSYDCWLIFDDDIVELMDERGIQSFFGACHDRDNAQSSESGYILFYQARYTTTPVHHTLSGVFANAKEKEDEPASQSTSMARDPSLGNRPAGSSNGANAGLQSTSHPTHV